MNKMQFHIITILALILCFSACDDDNNSNQIDPILLEFFDSADTDGNGIIDKEELETSILNDFSNLDSNNDGMLMEDDHDHEINPEYLGEPIKAEERIELLHDKNEDEIITQEEYMESVNEKFVEPMDINNNDEITLEEYINFIETFN